MSEPILALSRWDLLGKVSSLAASATSVGLILFVRRKCIADPNLTLRIGRQSIPLPSCSQLAGEDGPTSKCHIGSRREPSYSSTIEVRGHSQVRQLPCSPNWAWWRCWAHKRLSVPIPGSKRRKYEMKSWRGVGKSVTGEHLCTKDIWVSLATRG